MICSDFIFISKLLKLQNSKESASGISRNPTETGPLNNCSYHLLTENCNLASFQSLQCMLSVVAYYNILMQSLFILQHFPSQTREPLKQLITFI